MVPPGGKKRSLGINSGSEEFYGMIIFLRLLYSLLQCLKNHNTYENSFRN